MTVTASVEARGVCKGQRSNGVRHGKGAKSKKLLLSRLYRMVSFVAKARCLYR